MGKPIRFEVVGEEKVAAELMGASDAVLAAAAPVIKRGALRVANRIVNLLNRGSRSGIEYPTRGGGVHQASAEGEPPKSEEGFLAGHVKPSATTTSGGVVTSEVIISAEYAGWLEDGTDFMGPRPFVEPSFQLERPAIDDDMAKAVRGAL